MMRLSSILSAVLVLVLAAACGRREEPEQPAPEPEPATRSEPAPPPPPPANTADDDAERMRREAEAMRALRADLLAMINFDFDKADVRPADQPNLDRKAAILAANPGVRVRISGHADERGSDEYNLALGTRRAAAAKRYLAAKGIDEARIEVVSFGEERPLDPGHTEDSWAKNRRDEFEIIAGGETLVAPR